MINETIINNSVTIGKIYFPNLFEFICIEEFKKFITNSYNHTKEYGVGTPYNNFILTFFKLAEEHYENQSHEIRNEFGYFNYLLGEHLKLGKSKAFKNLILGLLNNPKHNDFKNILGEIGVCLTLSQNDFLKKYERLMPNGKSMDFEFLDKSNNVYWIEVLNIDFDSDRYENSASFEKFFCKRLKDKFDEKTFNLNDSNKSKVYIYPIIHGFTIDIIHENEFFLKILHKQKYNKVGFNSYAPRAFGNIQGTFFDLFTIEQIVDHKV